MTERPIVYRRFRIKGGPYWLPKYRVDRYDEGTVYRFWCLRVFAIYRVSHVPPMGIYKFMALVNAFGGPGAGNE